MDIEASQLESYFEQLDHCHVSSSDSLLESCLDGKAPLAARPKGANCSHFW